MFFPINLCFFDLAPCSCYHEQIYQAGAAQQFHGFLSAISLYRESCSRSSKLVDGLLLSSLLSVFLFLLPKRLVWQFAVEILWSFDRESCWHHFSKK